MTDDEYSTDYCEKCGDEFGDEQIYSVVRVEREQQGDLVTIEHLDDFADYYHPGCLNEYEIN